MSNSKINVWTDSQTKVFAERLDKQHCRILQLSGVVRTIRNAVESKDDDGQDRDLVAMFDTLCVVEKMLTDIAGELEPPVVLAREVAEIAEEELQDDLDLEGMAKIAEKLDIPLWILMIPGLAKHRELLKPGALKPLQAIVENYLESAPGRRNRKASAEVANV